MRVALLRRLAPRDGRIGARRLMRDWRRPLRRAASAAATSPRPAHRRRRSHPILLPPPPRRTAFATDEAIASEVDRIRKEMFNARIKFAKREDFKPAQYGDLRSRVAQLLTIKREREIAAGVSKREARAAEKRFLAEAGLGRL